MTVQHQVIQANIMLYRASLIVEPQPQPRLCDDTGKTGVYFSMNHPFLSENMVIEYDSDLPIAVYKTIAPITVSVGKNASKTESHVDYKINPVNDTANLPYGDYYTHYPAAELFLTQENLSKIQYLGCYFRTVKEAYDIWGKILRLYEDKGDVKYYEPMIYPPLPNDN